MCFPDPTKVDLERRKLRFPGNTVSMALKMKGDWNYATEKRPLRHHQFYIRQSYTDLFETIDYSHDLGSFTVMQLFCFFFLEKFKTFTLDNLSINL